MNYDPRYQTGPNGPLTALVRERFNRAKNKLNLTLGEVGARVDFSGPFMSQLLRDDHPARMRTKHTERVVAALEKLEFEAGLGPAPSGTDAAAPARIAVADSLEALVRAAHNLGFEVSFKPLSR
jgi:hypothetical protein